MTKADMQLFTITQTNYNFILASAANTIPENTFTH